MTAWLRLRISPPYRFVTQEISNQFPIEHMIRTYTLRVAVFVAKFFF